MDQLAPDAAPLPVRADTGPPDGPLEWPGYAATRARAADRSGASESVVGRVGRVGGHEAVLLAFEFGYLGGSIGRVAGERIGSALRTAADLGLPLVSLLASGGTRVQEGMHALTQLQHIAREMVRLRAAGPAHLAVLAGPVTGGAWVTLGAGADVRLALPGVQVGFSGARVRPAGVDASAYTAEGQLAMGQVDELVPWDGLPAAVAGWLALLTSPAAGPVAPPGAVRPAEPAASGWQAVARARAADRPDARAYLAAAFSRLAPLACVDPGLLVGFGERDGRAVGYVAQLGTRTSPAGFRAATRLIRLADRLSIPVLTLVDTPGAANDERAERDGVGAAVAETIAALAGCRVPVTTLLVGEGGSGGAVALTSPDRLWVAPESYYSVLAPEPAAAVLKRDPADPAAVAEVADLLRLRPQDLVAMGLARGMVE
ncbi:carboxyl transferase domain-containing protein [Streptomyces sp. DSM 44915]|uniref:acetyl-CoA carboxytransferase n=1 Tax=Streptomyces chisholmiae TaxID=3075540 RepID=A0ABU2JUN8_9ACTN|nr:carboxyl transferase domain-containing protein [Streptomyces sp. DSM 44915]MDT0268705.1 carboxyl transferase domain-containing protein [Streptomyces sp. DSM 44915]